MLNQTYSNNVKYSLLEHWSNVAKCKKPIIAAVNGYAVSSNSNFYEVHKAAL